MHKTILYVHYQIFFDGAQCSVVSLSVHDVVDVTTGKELGSLLTSYIRIMHLSWDTLVLCSLSQF